MILKCVPKHIERNTTLPPYKGGIWLFPFVMGGFRYFTKI